MRDDDEIDAVVRGAHVIRLGNDFRWPDERNFAVVFSIAFEVWSDSRRLALADGNPLPAGTLDTNAFDVGYYGLVLGLAGCWACWIAPGKKRASWSAACSFSYPTRFSSTHRRSAARPPRPGQAPARTAEQSEGNAALPCGPTQRSGSAPIKRASSCLPTGDTAICSPSPTSPAAI